MEPQGVYTPAPIRTVVYLLPIDAKYGCFGDGTQMRYLQQQENEGGTHPELKIAIRNHKRPSPRFRFWLSWL